MFKTTSSDIKIYFNTICRVPNIFLCFYMFKYTMANKKYILHFYNELENISEFLNDLKLHEAALSKFINKDYKCYQHTICTNCYKIEIFSENIFPLRFNSKDSDTEINNIYIKDKILNHNEFIHFKYFIRQFPALKENLSLVNLLRFIRIFDVFEFENDKESKLIIEQMIEILLLSIAYNIRFKGVSKVSEEVGINFSVSFLKRFFYKILEIFLFNREFLNTIKLKNEIDTNICDVNLKGIFDLNDFLWFDTELFRDISKKARISIEFKNLLTYFFHYFSIKKVVFSGIHEYTDDYLSVCLLLLPSINEICLVSCSDITFLKFLNKYEVFKNITTLAIINSRVDICSSDFSKLIILFDTIIFLNSNFFKSISINENIFSITEIITKFNNEISNNNKRSSFFHLRNNTKYEINTKDYKFSYLYSPTSFKNLDIKVKKDSVRIYYSVNIEYDLIKFYLLILNFEEIIYFDIYIENISIKRLIFKELNIKNKIKNIYIFNSKITESFLNDVLFFPNCIGISFEMCYFEFDNLDFQFKKNLSIIYLKIDKKCEINYFEKILEFIDVLDNLESLNLNYNDIHLLCINLYGNSKFSWKKIKRFESYEISNDENILPNFSFFPNIQELVIRKNYQDSMISHIFSYKNMENIHNLEINSYAIGLKDRAALKNLRNLKNLRLEYCDFENIAFSDLFDIKDEYFIENLKLSEIILEKRDIIFISELKDLKSLKLNFLFFKNFSYLTLKMKCFKHPTKLELEINIYWSLKNKLCYFMEEFGPKYLNLK
ncbi:hypothetical protein CWI36_0172p0010 [Hamiltosporidium magnivora]|uniref:Leucine-rich repeat-containing protein n=2 Tax=Hamiltosporidium magnivora TaxID=148818 RepID=A0A4Q9LJH5_9MICR|nr:hypothetical protein CWI36_0172p0010 [Hamiltosporidium magnivora]